MKAEGSVVVEEKRETGLKFTDFASSSEVRWCPGCGDYSILKQVQTAMAELGLEREKTVFISGIGCSSRFPYYMNTYGLHTIHGRALPIATGLKTTRPELNVWVATGDGDCLSIGGNHFLHTLRRNPDIKILLFNNQIYGLTKGQISPTSERFKVTKSTPVGAVEEPVKPLALALGAGASFVARSIDRDPKHLQAILKSAHYHKGTALMEIYQNCNIFNDGAFFLYSEKETRANEALYIEHGKPLIFGEGKSKGIRLNGMIPEVVSLADGYSESDLWIHDDSDLTKAKIMADFEYFVQYDTHGLHLPRPFGIFFRQEKPVFEEMVNQQISEIIASKGSGKMDRLLSGAETWIVD